MTADDINISLKKSFYKSNKMVLSNVYMYAEESDFLILTNKFYTHEIEIKISKSDFKADFKKKKHEKINNYLSNKNYIVNRYKTTDYSSVYYSERRKRMMPKNKKDPYQSYFSYTEVSGSSIPNKFSFCVPENLVNEDEVPYYSGLYYLTDFGVELIKPPQFIHKEKFDMWQTLAFKLYYRK